MADRGKRCTVRRCNCDKMTSAEFNAYANHDRRFALGCPRYGRRAAGGAEPMYWNLRGSLSGTKPVGLFGSYGWGDGEWIRTWASRMLRLPARRLVADPVKGQRRNPDGDATDACNALGTAPGQRLIRKAAESNTAQFPPWRQAPLQRLRLPSALQNARECPGWYPHRASGMASSCGRTLVAVIRHRRHSAAAAQSRAHNSPYRHKITPMCSEFCVALS